MGDHALRGLPLSPPRTPSPRKRNHSTNMGDDENTPVVVVNSNSAIPSSSSSNSSDKMDTDTATNNLAVLLRAREQGGVRRIAAAQGGIPCRVFACLSVLLTAENAEARRQRGIVAGLTSSDNDVHGFASAHSASVLPFACQFNRGASTCF